MCVIPMSAIALHWSSLVCALIRRDFELRTMWHLFLAFQSSSSHPRCSWILLLSDPPILGL